MPFKFPYTNFQELNLDWIIKKVKDLSKQIEDDSSIVSEYTDRLLAVEEKADNAEATATAADARATGANNTANSALTLATQAKQTAEIADLSTTLLGLKIGDLSSLYTTAKDTIVNAINEVWSIFHNATAVTNVTPAGTDPAVTYSNGVFTFDLPEGGDPDAVTQAELDAAIDGVQDQIDDLSEELDNKADVIIDTASGDIATFPDGTATPLKSLIVNIEPVQAGSGNPSPNNIRPLSGWTGCEIWRTGKNLYNPAETEQNKWVTDQGIVNQSGYWLSGYILLKANRSYIRSQTGSGRCAYFDLDKNFKEYFIDYSLIITPTEDCYLRFVGNEASYPAEGEIQFEVGTTATDFEEYKGNTFPVIWNSEAGIVYKGEVNLTTGELTPTHALVTKNTATMNNAENFPGWTNAGVRDLMGNGIDSVYVNQILNIGTSFAVNTTYDILYLPYTGSQGYSLTQSQFIALAIDVQVLIPIANPVIIQLTPSQINALKGYNAIWSDAGAVDVTYRADTKGYIDKLIAQVQALALGG